MNPTPTPDFTGGTGQQAGYNAIGAQLSPVSNNSATAWNQNWNTAWNVGFNNPYAPIGPQASDPGYSQGYSAGQQAFMQRHPYSGGSVLGASTSQTPSNAGSSNTGGSNLLQQNADAAQQNAQAQIQAAQNQYTQLQQQLEAQKPVLQAAYDKANSDLQNQLDTATQTGQQQRSDVQSQGSLALGQAGQNYQEAQGQNRELARALGSFGTDYAQLQNKTSNNYANQTNSINTDMMSRINQIDQGLTSLQQWGAAQKQSLASQLQQGMQQIVLNENASDFAKADAINKIKADFGNQMSNINNMVLQLGSNLAQAKAQAQAYMSLYTHAGDNFDPMSYLTSLFGGAPAASTTLGGPTGDNTKNSGPTGTVSATPDFLKILQGAQ